MESPQKGLSHFEGENAGSISIVAVKVFQFCNILIQFNMPIY
jgi:hypothetical protein